MKEKNHILSRREFLKLSAVALAAMALPISDVKADCDQDINWPEIDIGSFPVETKNLLNKIPSTYINQTGHMVLTNKIGEEYGEIPLLQNPP